MIRFILVMAVLLVAAGCKKDDPDKPKGEVPAKGLIVINEGNYTFGNASITLYNPDTKAVTEDVFTNTNGRPLGDVAQSMTVVGGLGYIVVNNSGKIEVVNMTDFSQVASISGLISPRYMLPLGDGRAYVTDLYAEAITIIDLNSNTITGTIALPGWTEQLALADGKVFVCNYDSSRVEVIDPATDTKTGHIAVQGGPSQIVIDANAKLWVSGAKKIGGNEASLNRIDPQNRSLELSIPLTNSATNLTISADGKTLYFLQNGVKQMPITDSQVPADVVIAANGRTLYGLGLNVNASEIYVSDALDYNQKGLIYRYNAADYTVIDSFKAGIIPGTFLFY